MPEPRPNSVDYLEIPSRDVTKSKVFFTALFGLKFTDYGPDYVAFEDGRLSGGFYTSDKVSSVAEGAAIIIFYTEHLESRRERAITLGANITRDIFAFPGGRRFHFAEPGGSEFAIWSDK
jgi:predicted enzyme related to lactoylglutathione lyase